ACQRLAHEVGHRAEVLGDDLAAGRAKNADDRLAERQLIRFVGRREVRRAAVAGPAVGAIEADEVIDAVAVEKVGTTPRALAQPREIIAREAAPAVERRPPSLPSRADRVWGRADAHVEMNLLRAGPDVGAVEIDHERETAKQRDAVGGGARVLP